MIIKNKKNIINLAVTVALFLLFILFTILVKRVDVKEIGPMGTCVGLAAINGAVRDAVGLHLFWYELTECVGIVVLLIPVIFCIWVVVQLVARRDFMKVDADLYALVVLYVLVAAAYILFEKSVVNYRPVILNAVPEASYPSSHTLLAVCVLSTAAMQVKAKVKKSYERYASYAVLGALAGVVIIGRVISGVHWFTDIMGGIILGAAFVFAYYTAVTFIGEKLKQKL